jgi:hypothetical protein
MDIDFHYHATYVAALLAGYSKESATTIAHAGEYIDDSDNSRLIDTDKLGIVPLATALPFMQLISGGRMNDWSETTILHDRRMWTAFHFLPGNLDHTLQYQGKQGEIGLFDRWQYDNLADEQFRSICLPDSPLAIAMVNDTVDNHAEDLHLIGIRMHVLIDTFAHMLFCGSAAWHVNDVNAIPEMQLPDGSWFAMPPLPEFAPQEIYYNSLSYTGHGRMGHVPDFPWITYRYKPQWSAEPIVKDNPRMYRRAFQEMVRAMTCIRTRTRYTPPGENEFLQNSPEDMRLLDEITKVIKHVEPHYLTFQDYLEERCQVWLNSLPALERHAGKSLPQPAVYNPDQWRNEAVASTAMQQTDYYKFHRAAHTHLNFVRQELHARGLSLLGGLGPVELPYNKNQPVQSGFPLFIKHSRTEHFINDPIAYENWPLAVIGEKPCIHKVVATDKDLTRTLKDNDWVRIVCTNEVAAGANMLGYRNLYSSAIGRVFLDQESDNSKQIWQIRKTKKQSNSPGSDICFGDEITFWNNYYPDSDLYVYKEIYIGCDKNISDGSDKWVVLPAAPVLRAETRWGDIRKTERAGSAAGTAFDDVPTSNEKVANITKVVIRSGEIIDNITVWYGNEARSHGGHGGSEAVMEIAPGDYISAVSGITGAYVGRPHILQLKLTTRNGVTASFGLGAIRDGMYPVPFSFELGADEAVVGFFGSVSDDAAGFSAPSSIGLGIASLR